MNARLLRDGQPIPLTPKAYDVLAFLCTHPDRLIGKEELLDTVWQRRFVSDGVLKNTIQELRRALGDDPKSPRFIETVHRRGYRLIGVPCEQPESIDQRESPLNDSTPVNATNIVVGRDDMLNQLRQLLELCQAGQPQTVFLSGEPGIGKTTLIRKFSATLPTGAIVVSGQCVDQHGEVEPFLPFLEALNQLSRRCGKPMTESLRRYAPTWLAQLPWLQTDAERSALHDVTPGLSKERMQRELYAFLEHWTRNHPHALVLILEDLHWSDHATLDAIAYLARQCGPARWMILGSYRPVDMLVNAHPLRQVMSELHLHRRCHDLVLDLLPEASVVEYLKQRFADNPLSDRLVRAIHRRTEGLPLYLAHLSNELAAWREQNTRCTDLEIEAFFETLPESLRLFIEQQFSRLPAESQAFLDIAAVGSNDFSPAMLAAVTGSDILEAEGWCEHLVGGHHILMRAGPPHHPERRFSGRYAFIHAYYQKLAYERIPPLRRASLHLTVARWIEVTCGTRNRDLAAEIAMHFERGRNYDQALHYFRIAVENALGRHEPQAVLVLSRRALNILEQHLPDTEKYAPVAVELYTTLATAVQVTHGWADPELQSVFDRLLHHAQNLEQSPHWLRVLWSMMGFHFVCGQLGIAEQYAGRMLAAGESRQDALLCGHIGKIGVRLYSGRLDSALEHFQSGKARYSAEHRGMFQMMAVHPIVLNHFLLAQVHWLRGYPDQALICAGQGISVARADASPFSLNFIQWGELICRQLRGEAHLTLESCQMLIAETENQDFALMHALAITHLGWTFTNQGRIEEGLDLMHRGINTFRATGAHLSETYLLSNCIDALLRAGMPEQGNDMLNEAFALMKHTGEHYLEADLLRLKGELMQTVDPVDAERHYRSAISIARRQGAKSLELRAAMSLARLWPDPIRKAQALSMLFDVYSTFREGLDTGDLCAARQLLEAMHECSVPTAPRPQAA